MKADLKSTFEPRTEDGRPLKLAMQHLHLEGTVTPAGARLLVRHSFVSGASQPLEIVYAFALPRDAALRRFVVHAPGIEAHSDLKPRGEARKTYEHAIDRGHLATLAETYRDGVVNLTLGNIMPGERVDVVLELLAGVDVTDDALRFRFPFTVAPCYHPKAIHYECAPGIGITELPADSFGDVFLPPVARPGVPLHAVSFRLEVNMPHAICSMASPSHHLRTTAVRPGTCVVELATDADVPNRDLVLDVRQDQPFRGVLAGVTPQGTQEFCAIVASSAFSMATPVPRRIVFVLDRSGSMSGQRIAQARTAVLACLGALDAGDQVGFVAFDSYPSMFEPALCAADDGTRAALRTHLEQIHASGGTELQSALTCAADILGEAGGDVLLITDGEVSETESITAAMARSNLHVYCLGIGDAGQDRFLAHLARVTGGASRYVTARERVDTAVLELFAALGTPMADNVDVRMDHAAIKPPPPTRVLSGRPLVMYGSCDARSGPADLLVTWGSKGATERIALAFSDAAASDAETLRLVRGARLISDVEATYGDGGKGRTDKRVTQRLVSLAKEFNLANRAMSLVAVVKRPDDRRGELPHTTVVPVGMPADADFEAYFTPRPMTVSRTHYLKDTLSFVRCAERCLSMSSDREPDYDGTTIAAALLSDGGLPAQTMEMRVLITLAAALALHMLQIKSGRHTFERHLTRMQRFITSHGDVLDPALHETVTRLLSAIARDVAVEGDWAHIASSQLAGAHQDTAKLVALLTAAAARVAGN